MYERDRQTDAQTHKHPHDGIGRACIASRGKNHCLAVHAIVLFCNRCTTVHTSSTHKLSGTGKIGIVYQRDGLPLVIISRLKKLWRNIRQMAARGL